MQNDTVNVIDILEDLGLQPRRKGRTNGGEWKSPCPNCGGDDRLCSWPNHPHAIGGMCWCRQCSKGWDAMSLLHHFKHLPPGEALKRLNTTRSAIDKARDLGRDAKRSTPEKQVPSAWQVQAEEAVDAWARDLWQFGGPALDWLVDERGLNEDTIDDAQLGFLEIDEYDDAAAWGLDLGKSETTGKAKKLWLPGPSLVIPGHLDGLLVRARFRLFECCRKWLAHDDPLPKYMTLQGSMADTPYLLNIYDDNPIVLVESDLDALLVNQEAGDLVGVVALGSACFRVPRTEELFERDAPVLVALDHDLPGRNAAHRNWVDPHPGNAVLLPLPNGYGKDPCEAWQAGLDIRAWIEEELANAPATLARRLEEKRQKRTNGPAPF